VLRLRSSHLQQNREAFRVHIIAWALFKKEEEEKSYNEQYSILIVHDAKDIVQLQNMH
jgi:hypothetical protein